jgi:glycolate oxidase FAD binding subunit
VTAAPALAAYAIDGVAPARSVAAGSEQDVVDTVRAANADGDAVVLWGGGTRIGIGDPPLRYDVALDLRGLSGIVDHQPADLTVTVRAGTTVRELQSALAAHGQWWPVEVAHPERATVGGTIASAADGPARYRYFHPRDWAIGARAVLGDGTLTKAGGKVVKNVTGYDLTRLYSGSFGTLCVLVELTLKLAPRPARVLTLKVDLPGLTHAYRTVREVMRERPPFDAVAVVVGPRAEALGSPTWAALFVRLAGSDAAVERLRAELAARLPATEAPDDVWRRIADLPADSRTTLRGTWPAGEPVEPYATELVWYPGIEIAHVLDDQDEASARQLRAAAESAGGALIVERAPAALRAAIGTWGTPRIPAAVAQGLRERFDPRGVLAPGRMP